MVDVSPAYLWYPKDALSSGRIDELTASEECWYRRALDRSWLDDGVPADPAKLARQIKKGCTAKAAKMILGTFFEPHRKDPAKMVNSRQEKERKKLQESARRKSLAGKKGMAKRWKREKQTTSSDNSVITPLITKDNIPIPIAIPIARDKRKRERPPRTDHPAIIAVHSVMKRYPYADQFDEIIDTLGDTPDIDRLRACWKEWAVVRRYNGASIEWITDWYVNGIRPRSTTSRPNRPAQVGKSNGHAPAPKCGLCHDTSEVSKPKDGGLEWEREFVACPDCASYSVEENPV